MPKTTDFTAMPTNASVLEACKENAINSLKEEFGIHVTETEAANINAQNSECTINKAYVDIINEHYK